MDTRLLDILVCPLCKGPLQHQRGGTGTAGAPLDGELLCRRDRLAFPISDGIPVMLVDEARKLPDSDDAPATPRAP